MVFIYFFGTVLAICMLHCGGVKLRASKERYRVKKLDFNSN